jgi:hypothetical protein
MTTEPTCIHGMLVRWCSLCRVPLPAPKEPVALTYGARDQSVCPSCEQVIQPDDVVMKLMPSGDVVHEYCSW